MDVDEKDSNVELPFDRRRRVDLANMASVKGWHTICLEFSANLQAAKQNKAKKVFKDCSLISDRLSEAPLAVIFERATTQLGVALLPHPVFPQHEWVQLIVARWAQTDTDCFPHFRDWTKMPEWQTRKETDLALEIGVLEEKKQALIEKMDGDIATLTSDSVKAWQEANEGLRMLLTAQADELVGMVAQVFRDIGFEVDLMDKEIPEGSPKREDLRIREIDSADADWEAIVEVRGYTRSSGKTADLSRMARFAKFYNEEKGKDPDKRLYVVNGEIELLPPQRQEPFASAKEDMEAFAEQGGVVIWTLDLFRLANNKDELDLQSIRNDIKEAEGRLKLASAT